MTLTVFRTGSLRVGVTVLASMTPSYFFIANLLQSYFRTL